MPTNCNNCNTQMTDSYYIWKTRNEQVQHICVACATHRKTVVSADDCVYMRLDLHDVKKSEPRFNQP